MYRPNCAQDFGHLIILCTLSVKMGSWCSYLTSVHSSYKAEKLHGLCVRLSLVEASQLTVMTDVYFPPENSNLNCEIWLCGD